MRRRCLWLTPLVAIFWSFTLFDTLGDTAGAGSALALALSLWLVPGLLYLLHHLCGQRMYRYIPWRNIASSKAAGIYDEPMERGKDSGVPLLPHPCEEDRI